MFFVDECLRCEALLSSLPLALADGETMIEPNSGTLDEQWIPDAGRRGWIVLSKDRAMARRGNHLEAILAHDVALVTVGEANGAEHARRIVGALPTIRRVARTTDVAFVARVGPACDLAIAYAASAKLDRPRSVKQKIHERAKP